MALNVIFLLSALLAAFPRSLAIPINNGVVGPPEIECGTKEISISVSTQQAFNGRIYAKGFSDVLECSVRGTTQINSAEINLPFDRCGVRRQRQINPAGISISTVVIVSFHPTFLTKVDRAYRISCFYMEAVKTVAQEFSVSMLSTSLVTRQMSMPVCRYEILSGSAEGPPVRFAQIGDSVYHKWTCVADQPDMFCMKVHSCTVGDGQGGQSIMVINENGCGVDRYILQSLEYISDLMAGQEAHVFKFADRPALNFNCQIELSLRDPEVGCSNAQPQCVTIGESVAAQPSRVKREVKSWKTDFDLPQKTLVVFDLQDKTSQEDLLVKSIPNLLEDYMPEEPRRSDGAPGAVCFAEGSFAGLMVLLALSIVSCLSAIVFLIFSRSSIKQLRPPRKLITPGWSESQA